MKTFANGHKPLRKWYMVDAENKTLGRLATEVATVIERKT